MVQDTIQDFSHALIESLCLHIESDETREMHKVTQSIAYVQHFVHTAVYDCTSMQEVEED